MYRTVCAKRGWRRRPGPHESTFAGPMDFWPPCDKASALRERQKSVRGRPRNAGRAVPAFDDSMFGDSSSSLEFEFEIGILQPPF